MVRRVSHSVHVQRATDGGWFEQVLHGGGSLYSAEEHDVRARGDEGERDKGGRALMGMITDWPSLAACRNGDPDALFVQGAEQNVAKRICRSCPVRYECLADALDNRIEFGVWGGMTERERRALLRRHPQITNWKRMFETALREQDRDKVLVGAN